MNKAKSYILMRSGGLYSTSATTEEIAHEIINAYDGYGIPCIYLETWTVGKTDIHLWHPCKRYINVNEIEQFWSVEDE